MTYQVLAGSCIDHMRSMDENSIHAIVTDSPYDLTTARRYGPGQKQTKGPVQYQRLTGGFLHQDWDATGIAFKVETWAEALRITRPGGYLLSFGGARTHHRMVCAMEDAGWEIRGEICWLFGTGMNMSLNLKGEYEGWSTGLRPGMEPITVARKPFSGSVKDNMARWGVGALHIDACRIPGEGARHLLGRAPTNAILEDDDMPYSRYFYCPKPSRHERELGCEDLPTQTQHRVNSGGLEGEPRFAPIEVRNNHPTCKGVALLSWLCRLVCPEGGTIYDPFLGSGTTGVAALQEGFNFIGSELTPEYVPIALARIAHAERTVAEATQIKPPSITVKDTTFTQTILPGAQ